ncbi:MAG: YlbF family regulator [Verrucomicrobiota bacterium JB023]|nr:YlbF family regulator [Verrucomicrobiota bacterium JB023]
MSFFEDDSTVMVKTRELCEAIAADGEFGELQKDVQVFLNDDSARESFRRIQEWGDDLHQRQGAGLALPEEEVKEFESAREELFSNPVATNFLQAQQTLQALQGAVGRYVGMTLELGRVPTGEDMAAAQGDGCCGGGGGGGCGCG